MAATKKAAPKKPSLSQRIADAREIIKKSPLKKGGRNTYSNYDYFTPEQINQLVSDACNATGLVTFFNLNRTEFGLEARLTVEELNGNSSRDFTMAMEIPTIKATNVAQQLGGAMTYSKRYLEMTAFDIVENSLDFDTTENTKKQVAAQNKPKPKARPAKTANSPEIRQAPKASNAGKKVDKSGKIMNAATAKYFESKCGDIPLEKLEKALLEYNTADGYGLIVQTMLDTEREVQSKAAKK